MLTLYKRHTKKCGKTDRLHGFDKTNGLCKCPCWVEGTTDAGQYVRQSLKTSSKEKAEQRKRKIEGGEQVGPPPSITPAEARKLFLEHLKKKNVSATTVRKFELILEKLEAFAQHKPLNAIDTPMVERFRNQWTWGSNTSAKYIERLRRFWKHAIKQKWATENPALDLEIPKIPPKQVAPFEPEELKKIEAEASKHPRHYAMVLLLRHSGLRIADAVMLQRRKVKNGKLFLYTSKTGSPVWLPLPDHVIDALEKCPNKSNDFFFATGEGKKSTSVNNWRDDLAKLFVRAKVQGGHPHRYRHTLAASLLEQGVPVTEVAMILGNSAKVVEKHYAGWNLARQKKLEELVRTTWAKRALVRVK
jgi:site-specific recombinase XerD